MTARVARMTNDGESPPVVQSLNPITWVRARVRRFWQSRLRPTDSLTLTGRDLHHVLDARLGIATRLTQSDQAQHDPLLVHDYALVSTCRLHPLADRANTLGRGTGRRITVDPIASARLNFLLERPG